MTCRASADDFAFGEFEPDWEHFAPVRAAAERAMPVLRTSTYERFLCAPESFTPDVSFCLGETPEVGGAVRRRRLQLPGDHLRPRRRSGPRAVGRRRRPRLRRVRGRRRPLRHGAGQPALPPRAHPGEPRPALRPALAARAVARRTRRTAHAAHRPAGCCGRAPRRDQRLGATALVRPTGRPGRADVLLPAPQLVRPRGRGAPGGARGRGLLRPLLVRDVRRRRPRRAGRAAAPVHGRRRHGRSAGSLTPSP